MSKIRTGIIYVIDCESSLAESLVRRVADMGQYHMFRKWDMQIDADQEVAAYGDELKGLIISGSGKSINSSKHTPPSIPLPLLQANVPILAICYGLQYLVHLRGVPIVRCWHEKDPQKQTAKAAKKDKGEQGVTNLFLTSAGQESILFRGLGSVFPVWMKHNWMAASLPEGWTLTGSTERCPIAAMERGNQFALQFHPEPYNSLFGRAIIHNFLTYACGVDTPYF